MLISLLIPKNMQNFSQFYRLISKIVFFSTQKLQVRFPTGGAATGSLPGRPERLKNVPDHLALEAKVKIGPLSRCILDSSMLISMIFLLEYWHPTDKQHSTCRRTASTSRHASFRLSATTRGVLFISLAANGLHELLAIGHLVTGTEWRFQFWPFCFERVRRSHCPADEWERRHSEWLPFKHSRCCLGGPATSFEPPVKIKKMSKMEKSEFFENHFQWWWSFENWARPLSDKLFLMTWNFTYALMRTRGTIYGCW